MWWRRKKKQGEEESIGEDVFARKLLNGYRFVQGKWVGWLELLIKDWSVRKQQRALVLAVALGATYCGWLIFSGVTGHARDKLIIEKIQPGEYIGKPDMKAMDSSKRINNTITR